MRIEHSDVEVVTNEVLLPGLISERPGCSARMRIEGGVVRFEIETPGVMRSEEMPVSRLDVGSPEQLLRVISVEVEKWLPPIELVNVLGRCGYCGSATEGKGCERCGAPN